jgi:hypothetical protein
MGPGTILDVLVERKIPWSCRDLNTILSSLVIILRYPSFASLPYIYDLYYVSQSPNEPCGSRSTEYDVSSFTIISTSQLLQPD